MVKKQILRCVGFMLCLVMLTVLMCDLFECSNTRYCDKNMYTYRNLPKDSVDAVFLGTSGVDRYWIGAKAYEEYGMTVYNVSYDGMVSWLYTSLMDEVLSRQDPELVLIDLRPFYQDNTDLPTMSSRARFVIDSLPFFNINRVKAAFRTMEFMHESDEENPKFDASYLLSFIKFHTKWADDYSLYDNLGSKDQMFASYFMWNKRTLKVAPQKSVVFKSDLYKELDPFSEEALYEVIDYIEENDLQVLFVDTPKFMNEKENGRANTVYDILEENNLKYLNFYVPDSDEFTIDLDKDHDYYDGNHVNYFGAQKFTAALSKYLDENYDLPDNRDNPNAKEFWDGKYDKIKNEIKYFEKLQEKEKKDKK